MLNASIAIDADGGLTLDLEDPEVLKIRVSVAAGVYTFDSDKPIDLVGNDAGLDVAGAGTTTVDVGGITRLNFNLGTYGERLTIAGTDVPTNIHATGSLSRVFFGEESNPAGLTALTGPITVSADPTTTYLVLSISDYGSSRSVEYAITSDSLAATGGFGGISFSGVRSLELYGASTAAGGTASFDVSGVPENAFVFLRSYAQARSHTDFHVDAPPVDATSMNLIGGDGPNTFDIERTPAWILVSPGSGGDRLNLTRDGSTAGIQHGVVINSYSGGSLDVLIDDSAGLAAHDAALKGNAGWTPYSFKGFAALGGFLTFTSGVDRLVYKAPRGLSNSLIVDFGDRQWSPKWTFDYDGGGDGTAEAGGRVILLGSPPSIAGEAHSATGPGAGSIVLYGGFGGPQTFVYSGLAFGSLYDLVAVPDYQFHYLGGDDPGVAVSAVEASAATVGAQALRIASRSAPPAFVATTIANKANVTINTHGTMNLATRVDYASDEPVAGLASLTIVTSLNDAVDAVATPPGAAFTITASDAPRPAPPPPPAEPAPRPEEPAIDQPVGGPSSPSQEASGGAEASPIVPQPPVGGSPPAQDVPQAVGTGFASRFGASMRTGPSLTVGTPSPFRNLQRARMARLDALRARRPQRPLIRVSQARAWVGAGRPHDASALGVALLPRRK
ncbi:MAG: hypothetical protein P4L85_29050 [Paludisphaera borealis]|uniref:hypothetical protein n=1 Tax=Paludisphaera borealis TaxID=1387353 RepID=UPI0028495D24|nr:hypothetical protein [Paludisphaera borealis]MDR3623416.1 hypothetical protein [Paludisphaera borealis]